MAEKKLSHLEEKGAARLADASAKDVTQRVATAKGTIRMAPETLALILDNKITKGNVIEIARLAGIMAAKKTSDLIPLCHPLMLSKVEVEIEPDEAASALQVSA